MKTLSAILTILAAVALASCAKPPATQASDVDYYTCTMHPSVHLHDPDAKCPICGMELVPVKKVDAQLRAADAGAVPSDQPREFSIPVERQQLIGVTYAAVEKRPLKRTIRAVGTVAATTANHWDYVARVDGYVHNLNVSTPGEPVKKGQVLMDIYSPDLTATENEYIDLLRMRENGERDKSAATTQSAEHLLAGARARLGQWNISEEQVDALEKSGNAPEFLDLTSPVDGIVAEVAVHQGRHVAVGDHLVDLVSLSSVWVWADFYENEIPYLKPGQAVTISSSADPGLSVSAKIALVDPFLNAEKRTGRVRIDVENPEGRLRPDAYVDISLNLDGGQGLTIPVEAVMPTGQHNVVFVEKGSGRLEPRFVQLGGKYGDNVLVTSGLHEGERVVSSANFLVDAESKVQGALKSW
jgi:membrane fusion protein, copper/silver efflux system